jgi:hypothetical protein
VVIRDTVRVSVTGVYVREAYSYLGPNTQLNVEVVARLPGRYYHIIQDDLQWNVDVLSRDSLI